MIIDPTRYTPPLNPRADGLPTHSDGYRLLDLVDKHYKLPSGLPIVLDDYQRRLIIRFLETDASGVLRFRQVLFSCARQNSKSTLASILALYALIQHSSGASVIGIATNVTSAKIVYQRVAEVIKQSPQLSTLMRTTAYRGLSNKANGNTYNVMPAKSDALQGHTISGLGIVDEVHIVPEVLWDDMLNSARAHSSAMIIGLTTAGDDSSKLLHRLYKDAETELSNPDTRRGYFIFEAPEGADLYDPVAIMEANPAAKCGRISMDDLLADVQGQPESHVRRYVHNRFVTGTTEAWVPTETWRKRKGSGIEQTDKLVFGFQTSPGWTYASVAVARKQDDGTIATELVACLNSPDLDQLKAIAYHLKAKFPNSAFVMDTRPLNDLYEDLKTKGYDLYDLNRGGYLRAASTMHSLIQKDQMTHAGDILLDAQMPFAILKNVAGGFKIEPVSKGHSVDALLATTWACHIAATRKNRVPQLF